MRPVLGLLMSLLAAAPAFAGSLTAFVRDGRGNPVADAVVYALPDGRIQPRARKEAVMDQKDRMFIPHVLPVQTGTAVRFPNSDDVRHHVYSFSAAKQFQLPLYEGTPANPVVFDKAGVVMLGCNIHDRMSAFIVVVDTPHFARSGADGRITLPDLEAGRYTVRVWYPDMRREPPAAALVVAGNESHTLTFSTVNARP